MRLTLAAGLPVASLSVMSDRAARHACYRRILPALRHATLRAAARCPSRSYSELAAWAWLGVVEAFERRAGALGDDELDAYTLYRMHGALFDGIASADAATEGLRALSSRVTLAIRRLAGELRRPPRRTEIAGALGLTEEAYGGALFELAARGFARLELVRGGPGGGPEAAAGGADPDIQTAVEDALDTLPPSARDLFDFHYGDGLPLEVASARLGLDARRGAELHAEAIHRLRAALGRD